MKRFVALTLAMLLILALVPTAMAQDEPRTVKVGLSWNEYDVTLVTAWETYMKSEAETQGAAAGLKFEWVINAAGGDPARQAANIEDLINQGVDIIFARAEDAAAIGASIRAAEEAGIPFVTFDRASTTATPAAHVGGDSYAQGLSTAEAFAELLVANGVQGKCIELQGSLTDQNAVNRSVAWNEVDAASDAFETIVQVPTEWDATIFLSGTANALQANPDANCIFMASDFAITSVQSALESAGKWAPTGDPNHVWMATQDLFPEALTAMEGGYIDVVTTYDAYEHAKEAVRVLIALLKGEDPGCGEDGCLVAGRLVTPENFATLENLWSREFGQPPAETRTVTVGLSWNEYDVTLVTAWETYMKSEAETQGAAAGLEFEWVINAAGGDPARQAANIEDLINQGVDIIFARAEDAAAIGASIRAAEEAGIPFVTFDRASTTATPAAHVGGDSYQQGLDTAQTFAELLEANGAQAKCIELQGSLTDQNAVNRSNAWNEVDAASDAFETIVQVPTEWDATIFLSGTANALQANPDANCIFMASDFAITSVQSALESAGKWAPTGEPNHVWLATQDLFPEALAAMDGGYIDVVTTYDAYEHAKEAVRVLIALLNGEDPGCGEDGCLVAGRTATQENVDTLENLWSREFGGQ